MKLKEEVSTTVVGDSATTGKPIAGLDGTIGPKRRRNKRKTIRYFHRRRRPLFADVYYADRSLLTESQNLQMLIQHMDQLQMMLSMVDWKTIIMQVGKYAPTSGETVANIVDTVKELPSRIRDVRDQLDFRTHKLRELEKKHRQKLQMKSAAQRAKILKTLRGVQGPVPPGPTYIPPSVRAAGPVKPRKPKRLGNPKHLGKPKRLGKLKESVSVVFDIPSENWMKCIHGKPKYKHYCTYVGKHEDGEKIRQFARRQPKADIIVRDRTTGAHTYLRKR